MKPGRSTAGAEAAIRHIGTNALPYLLRWSDTQPVSCRTRLTSSIRKCPAFIRRSALSRYLAVDPATRRMSAVPEGFRVLGSMGTPAIPELYRRAIHGANRDLAARSIVMLRLVASNGVPALLAVATKKWVGSPRRGHLAPFRGEIGRGCRGKLNRLRR